MTQVVVFQKMLQIFSIVAIKGCFSFWLIYQNLIRKVLKLTNKIDPTSAMHFHRITPILQHWAVQGDMPTSHFHSNGFKSSTRALFVIPRRQVLVAWVLLFQSIFFFLTRERTTYFPAELKKESERSLIPIQKQHPKLPQNKNKCQNKEKISETRRIQARWREGKAERRNDLWTKTIISRIRSFAYSGVSPYSQYNYGMTKRIFW
jgi:hypothetical protein